MFQFQKNEIISDVLLITPQVYGDSRGFFMETYNQKEFVAAGISEKFVQDSHSLSQK
jgi:dTDP-4-dehydrorhamnose 3,5-epimerase